MVEKPNNNQRPFPRLRRRLKRVPTQLSRENPIPTTEDTIHSTENSRAIPHISTSPFSAHDLISSLDNRLLAILQEAVQTTDPARLQELARTATLLRRFRKNELSAERLKWRHLRGRLNRSHRRRKADSDSNEFDVVRLFENFQKLVDQHPTVARLTAERMGIDDLGRVLFTVGRILNSAKKNAFTEYVGHGLTELVRDAITKFGPVTPTPVNQQQTTPQQPEPPWSQKQQPPFLNFGQRPIEQRDGDVF